MSKSIIYVKYVLHVKSILHQVSEHWSTPATTHHQSTLATPTDTGHSHKYLPLLQTLASYSVLLCQFSQYFGNILRRVISDLHATIIYFVVIASLVYFAGIR